MLSNLVIDSGQRRVMKAIRAGICAVFLFGLQAWPAQAETGHDAWLRYAPLNDAERAKYDSLPASTVLLGDSPVLHSAQNELIRGVKGMLGRTLRMDANLPEESAIVLGTLESVHKLDPGLDLPRGMGEDGFWLATVRVGGFECLVVAGETDRGVLYGVFDLLSKIARNVGLDLLNERQQPYAPIRWADQWDNLDGSIERGYGGRSIFFEGGQVRSDLSRVNDYARLLASVGINGCAINNVNADPKILEDSFLPQLVRIADVFRPWGVRLSLSVPVNSPQTVGGLDTYDPLDPRVVAWWRKKVDAIYQRIPDFGGFVVKADSEGQPGPSKYGRTPADAANVIARALQAHSGVLFYRAFVYNHHLDWTNPKNDRARAAYDIFHPLDGKFADNVIIQIKYGPIDFQAREPVSPLFGGLEKTNEAIELQVTQEYTGQQRHLCFLPPMWEEILNFDMRVEGGATPVKNLVAGKSFHRPTGGLVGVVNVGLDDDWLGHPLAMANLYGFGRLAWDPGLKASAIAEEWTRLTFGNGPAVVKTITEMQMASWPAYESYTGPLGLQTLTDILGSHFGPGVEASERNGWGQWHRADHEGVGMDRSVATGTGFAGQYPPEVAKGYESLETTPDDLVLFFHHVPYTYALHSGKTVIQSIYDLHYWGADQAGKFVGQWESLRGQVDEDRYARILEKLEYQAGHAIVWRDAVCNWFLRESGVADAKDRVGHHPGRIEAEAMQLQGYAAVDVTPWENASGGKAVECKAGSCGAEFQFKGPAGWYEVDVQYFDLNNGVAEFRLFVGKQMVEQWAGDNHLPSAKLGGDTSTRRWIAGLGLRPGDVIRIEGTADAGDPAALDYIELHPAAK